MSITPVSVRQQLAQLTNSGGSHKEQTDKYRAILDSILNPPVTDLIECLKAFIENVVNENISLVISRQILTDMTNQLSNLSDDLAKVVSHFTLEKE